ncbi:hypothetical protein Tco_1512323, partial [Tanacetum coccineum]
MAAGGDGSGGGDEVEMVVRVLVAMVMGHGGEDDDVIRVASVVMVVVRWPERRQQSYREGVLKFVKIGEDYLEYGHPILDVMLTDAIKRSKSYQMFIKYSTNQILPKKSRGKGSKGRKAVDDSQETVDISEESEPKPEPAKKKTASRRVVKKKITLSADDNIISDDPDAALELAKSISQTEAKEAEAARKVHATHARIVTESIPESRKKKSGGRSPKSTVIQ